MNLKNRLKMAFITIIILPICMAGLIGKFIVNYQITSIQETYKIEFDTMQAITNPIQVLNRVTRDAFNRIKLYARKSPEVLENMDFIQKLNMDLKDKYSFLIVYKGEEVIFDGYPEMFETIKNVISTTASYSTEIDGGTYIGGKTPVLVKQQDFIYSDGAHGTIYVFTDVNNMLPQIRSFAIQAVFAFVFVIVITGTVLIIWLYRGIIQPLNTLKRATLELKQGNLNYSIMPYRQDEIGQLCEDFEEMRVHLKELIDVKMKYEKNSRELLSNISHDLKTPLTTIKGYSEGIIDGVADSPEKVDRYVRMIYTKAQDMQELVDELSIYSKLDCNELAYDFRKVSIADYFEFHMEELVFELGVKNMKVEFINDTQKDCRVIGDLEHLKRVFGNIIGNSVKYMDKDNGKVIIHIHDQKDFVKVEIKDNGPGIEEKDLPYIFERFYRADLSRNSIKGGSGLGLAIAKKIIEEHNGQVWAESKIGEGTSVYFTIPKDSVQVIEAEKSKKMRKDLLFRVKR